MGLMKKIDTDGLNTVIENIKDTHLDYNSINKLIQTLTQINGYIQTPSSVSLEQIQKQLGLFVFFKLYIIYNNRYFCRYGIFH